MLGKDGVLKLLSPFEQGEEREKQGDDKGKPEQGICGARQTAPEWEECRIESAGPRDVIYPKEYPAHHYNKESDGSGKWRAENWKLST